MADKTTEKNVLGGQDNEILGPTYEPGKPDSPSRWRKKLRNRKEMLEYLKTGERYWFSEESYGSERRRTKA